MIGSGTPKSQSRIPRPMAAFSFGKNQLFGRVNCRGSICELCARRWDSGIILDSYLLSGASGEIVRTV
jgi:hypothetical protein